MSQNKGQMVASSSVTGPHTKTTDHHQWDNHFSSDIEKCGDSEKPTHSRHASTLASACSREGEGQSQERTIVSFEEDDPLNPFCWPRWKKIFCVIAGVILVMNSTIGSSLSSGASDEVAQYFNIHSSYLQVLVQSIFLVGYILGPMVFPPLSESYGRKIVMIATFVLYTAFVLGCALAPNFASLVVFRLLVGIGASTPISVIGGIFADLYNNPKARGLAITSFMAATTWGPLIGPIISGFIAPAAGWRWIYWTELIIAGVTWPLLLLIPETFGPVILQRKAAKLRRKNNDPNIVAPADLEKRDMRELFVVVLTRPFRMILFEAIVLFTCLYLSLAYGIFYMFFQAYPIVFGGIYGFSAGEEGLAFLPIGVGALIATSLYIWWGRYLDRARARTPAPAWSQQEEYLRLPLACIGGPLFVISLFWLGWTARPSVPWIVPVLAALPFGAGFLLVFMGLINFLVDAYEVYAASAMGAASASRSIFGVVLPFAARPMYLRLGVGWACTLLGFLAALMSLIPFVFIRYGPQIRASSKFCQELRRKKEEEEEKRKEKEEMKSTSGNQERLDMEVEEKQGVIVEMQKDAEPAPGRESTLPADLEKQT